MYNSEIIKIAAEEGLYQYSFDFRPRSFNFIQENVFKDILNQFGSPFHRYYLRFDSGENYLFEYFMQSLKEIIRENSNLSLNQFTFELEGDLDFEYIGNLGLSYILHYNHEKPELFNSYQTFLSGVLLPMNFLYGLHLRHELSEFSQSFAQIGRGPRRTGDWQLILEMNWSSVFFDGLLEAFAFDTISFSINSSVEKSYRVIDKYRLKKGLTEGIPC